MRHPFRTLLFVILFSCGAWAALPDLDDPLIGYIDPVQGQSGQHVVVFGYNFGNAPQVTFNGTAAVTVAYRPDRGVLVVSVPSGAGSGPLVVTDAGTATASNVADFTVLPGTFTPVCTISGTVSDSGMNPVADVPVVALDTVSNDIVRLDVTDAAGHYTLGLPSAGTYEVVFVAPAGARFIEGWDELPCGGVSNHAFAPGYELSGTVRTNDIPFDPVKNSRVQVRDGTGDIVADTITDANGEFGVFVSAETYDVYFRGPVGSRLRNQRRAGVEVSSDTDVGDVNLDTGWLLSGVGRYQDSTGAGPLMDATLVLREQGIVRGVAITIVDGSFWLATAPCSDCTLHVFPGRFDSVPLEVHSIDVPSDTELERSFVAYSRDDHGTMLPTITDTNSPILKEGQITFFEGANLGGSSVSVHFPDGTGGWVEGDDTRGDPDRSLILTRVPTGAVSGNVHVRVDGVDSAGIPLTILPGVHDPGSYTISGTVTNGSNPVADLTVVLVRLDICEEDSAANYAVTDAGGTYSMNHATGSHLLYYLPPVSSGLVAKFTFHQDLTGNTVSDAVLDVGSVVTGRIVDSGSGPVGATGVAVPAADIEVEGDGFSFEDWVKSDASGSFSVNCVSAAHEVDVDPPPGSRYLGHYLEIGGPGDLGDIAIDSGYFIEGYIVDETGAGLPGIELSVREPLFGYRVGSGLTIGDDGWFRMAVRSDTYRIKFEVPRYLDYIIDDIESIDVFTDVMLYPAIEAEPATHFEGTVYLADGTTPVPEVLIDTLDPVTWNVNRTTWACEDGTYYHRVRPGTYLLQAWPGSDNLCLSRDFYNGTNGTYYICEAQPLAIGLSDPMTIDFTLEPAGAITGRVMDESSNGIPDAWLCVDEGTGSPACQAHCVSSDQDGWYVLDHAPVGEANRLIMSHPSLPTECWDGHVGCTDYDPIPVGDCTVTPGINFGGPSMPGPVPDGANVPGAPLTASYDPASLVLTVNWQPTCDAENHSLYVGDLGAFGAYTWASCTIGMNGTASLPAPAGDVFFLVVGNAWPSEGSYGTNSEGIERPSAGGAHCGYLQDLGYDCVP